MAQTEEQRRNCDRDALGVLGLSPEDFDDYEDYIKKDRARGVFITTNTSKPDDNTKSSQN